MDNALNSLINRYAISNENDFENVLKEVIQQIALLGLWRSKFFERAAFYGGTCVRVFYGLRRFSEDMDFSLLKNMGDFNLDPHLESVRKELASFGFRLSVEKKIKNVQTQIESAFIKGNTTVNLMRVDAPETYRSRFHKNKTLKIKLELDTDPPGNAEFEVKTLLTPIPFQVRLFSQPDLFAGKLHAVLCRQWKTRVKGRDLYDFVWYIGNQVPCHLTHLQARMEQTNHWTGDKPLTGKALVTLLKKRFDEIDFSKAKNDVEPFIKDPMELDLWSKDFFHSLLNGLMTV